jgi:glycosyltransferase involved in cell wall biosynthesis
MSELLNRRKIPYGVEVVGDPYDAFGPESIQHPLRPVFRWKLKTDLQKVVRKAEAALYVTRDYLQERYPIATGKYQTHASNVTLVNEAFVEQPKYYNGYIKEFNLISVGALAQMYKSPDIVLQAIKQLREDGVNCRLTWLGDGKYMDDMIQFAKDLGIDDHVSFEGRINSGRNVRVYLDNADIFILASKTEGLPRAMIEAMARALPCVGSRVGGIPELLDKEVIVPAGDSDALANLLKKMITSSAFLNNQSARNLSMAQSYSQDVLSRRREEFYHRVKSSVQIEN